MPTVLQLNDAEVFAVSETGVSSVAEEVSTISASGISIDGNKISRRDSGNLIANISIDEVLAVNYNCKLLDASENSLGYSFCLSEGEVIFYEDK